MKICQICDKEPGYNKHHIISKSFGGSNKKENIAHICCNCHYLVHKGIIIVEKFSMTSMGLKLLFHHKDDPSITNQEINKVYIFKQKI